MSVKCMKKVLVAVCLVGASMVRAADVSTVAELVSALEAINAGGEDLIVNLAPGTYDVSGAAMHTDAHLLVTKRGVVIQGTDDVSWRVSGTERTGAILDAKDGRRILLFSFAARGGTVRNVTFLNGYARRKGSDSDDGVCTDTYPRGAGISQGCPGEEYYGGFVSVSNCVFESCKATQGGATYLCAVDECSFTGCSTPSEGGAHVSGTTRNSRFVNNTSGTTGGAVTDGGSLITNCLFVGNSARDAGALAINGGQIVDCVFSNNVTWLYGGAISRYADRDYHVRGCTFVGNHSDGQGGGACYYAASISNCTFIGNYADTQNGGAVHGANQGVVFGCTFISNFVQKTESPSSDGYRRGGALFRCPDVQKCRFEGNTATEGGAAAESVLTDCTLVENAAVVHGGGLFRGAATNCVFEGGSNLSDVGNNIHGGAAAFLAASLVGCSFSGCVGNYGGALLNCGEVRQCVFNDCIARQSCAAACDCTLLDGCAISNCLLAAGASGRAAKWNCCAVGGTDEGAVDRVVRGTTFYHCGHETDVGKINATSYMVHENCTFIGNVVVYSKSATNCRFQDVHSPADGPYVVERGVMTNCLVTGCSAPYMFVDVREMVNCTVVSNNQDEVAKGWQVIGCNGLIAKNCLFHSSFHNDAWGILAITGGSNCTFQNCVYDRAIWGDNNQFVDCVVTNEGLFYSPMSKHYDPANPWKLCRTSPARNAGCAIDWPEGAVDILGNPRVNPESGSVDIGCYAYMPPPPTGCILILR